MGRRTTSRKMGADRFDRNLLQGILEHHRGRKPKTAHTTVLPSAPVEPVKQPTPVAPSKYLTAKDACAYLGIAKATFFRRKKEGAFQSVAVTNRYHIDDLDREVRGSTVNVMPLQ
jgi:hypothetical protein